MLWFHVVENVKSIVNRKTLKCDQRMSSIWYTQWFLEPASNALGSKIIVQTYSMRISCCLSENETHTYITEQKEIIKICSFDINAIACLRRFRICPGGTIVELSMSHMSPVNDDLYSWDALFFIVARVCVLLYFLSKFLIKCSTY